MNKFTTKMWTIDCKIERNLDSSYVVYSIAKGNTLETAQATARLIASAPDMYRLLKVLVHHDYDNTTTAILTHEAAKLLARIDGEEGAE